MYEHLEVGGGYVPLKVGIKFPDDRPLTSRTLLHGVRVSSDSLQFHISFLDPVHRSVLQTFYTYISCTIDWKSCNIMRLRPTW